ncbi:28 kDa ribonucleoprotein, chloroplastic [Apostasia shenzhenica]|uniref:28 kDa ribonucleoprotein, chloroplastic n=1 Tax=Apostasia shenzhenica TaxID=1088818 RepID=A0A2I0ABX8_9ASPA|nr:28 kDa ribonucleoprotein, chloroplastic [Apostasia shenzhenica]
MGKKLKESSEDGAAAVKSLFGADNPFRRKPQPFSFAVSNAGDNPLPLPEQGFGIELKEGNKKTIANTKSSGEGSAEVRKRKRETGTGAVTPRKRQRVEDKEKGGGFEEKSRKRKRNEIEVEYEKSKDGVFRDDGEQAAVVAVGEKRKLADTAADTVSTKESFDDESKLLRTIFVGNLPLRLKRKALQREFARFGEIDSIRIRSVPLVDTKAPRKAAIIRGKINDAVNSVNAYIVFKDEQSANAALSHNMAEIDGNHIRVDLACPPRKKMKGEAKLYERKRTVFVGNLPYDVKDEELYQLFCSLDQSETIVQAVRVIRDPNTSIGKGFAYVLFKTREAANSVCKKGDLKIRDRTLRVCHAKRDATPSNTERDSRNRDHRHRRFTTNSAQTPPDRGEKRSAGAADLSYQGLRSSQKGKFKTTTFRRRSGELHKVSPRFGGDAQAGHQAKRPAVAARKAKQLLMKRKQGNAPEHRPIKARRQ